MDWKTQLAKYDALVDLCPGIERKGKTVPYTSANGYMYSLLNKEGEFGIRLPKEAREQFLANHDSGELRSHGAVMRDYVLIPAAMLDEPESLVSYLQQAHEYVMSLPPK